MSKTYFIIDESKKVISKEDIESIEMGSIEKFKNASDNSRELSKKRLLEEDISLKHVNGRIVIKIDLEGKNTHTFENGLTIYRGRQFNELNRRITEPVNAWVIDAEYIENGSEILIHPNSICDANKIFNYANISTEEGNSLRYYSIETESAFLFREGETWKPLKNFATALRVFKPYSGMIDGIPPEQIKNVLYITAGEYKGEVMHTVRAADYEIIFMGTNGREQRIIRCRHYEDIEHDREELIIVRHDLTEQVNEGELLIGLSPTDCKNL